MTDQDLLIIMTLCCPFRDMFFDKGVGLIVSCKSGVSPFVVGMEPNWRSIFAYKH